MAALDMDRMRAHGKRFVDGFTPGQKAMTILGIVAVVFASMMFMRWAGSPTWGTLYTGLDSSDAAQVTDELNAQGVKYKLEDGGSTILVPQKDVYAVRVNLGGQGLPSGGHEGYPLLDEGGITQSEFSQRIDYQRAVQGELAKTLETMAGIKAAHVTLTIPKETVFVGGETDQPSASVVVDTGGSQLSSEAVQSVVNIVASSVANMTPESVTLTDANMNLLHAAGQSLNGGSGDTMEAKAAFEAQMAKSLGDFIAASLGPGNAKVDVEAQLDMSSGETHSTEYSPPTAGQTPTQETTSNESFTGPGNDATGVLGPDGTPSTPNSTPVSYTKTEADRQLAVNSIEETKKEAPGTLERLSVSVLMNADKVAAGDQAAWEAALSTAAGIDTARADAITVTRMPFDTEAQKQTEENLKAASTEASSNAMLDMIRYVVTLLIVGLVLFLAWRAIKKAEVNRVPLRVPLDLAQLEAGERRAEPAMAGVEQSLRLPAATPAAVSPAPVLEASNMPVEEEIAGIIEQQPDEVALTLRSWLADRRG